MPMPMRIRLNGEPREFASPLSVRGLLEELGLDHARVAVELNRRILKREEHAQVALDDGDEMEIVTFVGGG